MTMRILARVAGALASNESVVVENGDFSLLSRAISSKPSCTDSTSSRRIILEHLTDPECQ